MEFSLIIPVYNEERGSFANAIRQLLQNPWQGNWEIIVVDDGSDEKVEGSEILGMDRIKIIRHKRNRGYGAALKTGISNARNECIVITDADGTYPNERIPELVKTFQEGSYDMVVGARVGSKVKIPLIRKPAKWFITKLASYLTGREIPDLNSGLRVMKKEVVEKYIRILPDGFSFTSTITLATLTNGYSVKYVPIDYFKRDGKSKIKPIQDTLNFIQLIIRTVLYFNPLKIFVPLSFFLVLLAFLILLGSWILTGKAMDVTFGVVLMTAVMTMAIGMLADLIDKRL
jgi:glycosyltransferase involved in cell wall biosynthesis